MEPPYPYPQPPEYTPASLPLYSSEPTPGETQLQHSPRSRFSRSSRSVFIRRSGKTTVLLDSQEDGASIPSYGRHALIAGALCLDDSEDIVHVAVKLYGRLETTTSERGCKTTKLLNQVFDLWSRQPENPEPCPAQLPFSISMPATYKIGNEDAPLPPSYGQQFFAYPALVVRTVYQLHIEITRTRYRKVDMWTKTKSIVIPFLYTPRTRPHRPITTSPCFFSSVKTSPEEWYQAVTPLKTRPNATIDPIICHLFVPAGRIYGLEDTIPFHIQLSGSACALKKAFENSSSLGRVVSVDSDRTQDSSTSSRSRLSTTSTTPEQSILRVRLLRQIVVTSRGENSWRNHDLAEATITPIPPDLSSCCSVSSPGCREGHVDWEGQLRCSSDVTVGSFSTANVQVKDFIALTLTPPGNQKSPLLEMQITVPIRLVTDSFSDSGAFDTNAVGQ